MTPYHVAKLVEWAGTLRTRKRLQKIVYLLQAAGCEALDAEFILHHYGPYSPEVASLADQMAASGLLDERAEHNGVGVQYRYGLTERARQLVQQMESGPQGGLWAAQLAPFEQRARKLLDEDLSTLEYGATLVYFFRQAKDWEQAKTKTSAFKKLPIDGDAMRKAMQLANGIAR